MGARASRCTPSAPYHDRVPHRTPLSGVYLCASPAYCSPTGPCHTSLPQNAHEAFSRLTGVPIWCFSWEDPCYACLHRRPTAPSAESYRRIQMVHLPGKTFAIPLYLNTPTPPQAVSYLCPSWCFSRVGPLRFSTPTCPWRLRPNLTGAPRGCIFQEGPLPFLSTSTHPRRLRPSLIGAPVGAFSGRTLATLLYTAAPMALPAASYRRTQLVHLSDSYHGMPRTLRPTPTRAPSCFISGEEPLPCLLISARQRHLRPPPTGAHR